MLSVMAMGSGSLFRPLVVLAICMALYHKNIRMFFRQAIFNISIKWALWMFVISTLLTMTIIRNDAYPASATIVSLFVDVIFTIMFYAMVRANGPSFLRTTMNYIILACIILGVYTLFETITESNPYAEYMINNGYFVSDTIITSLRYGMKRSQGLFSMHTSNAGVCLLLFFVMASVLYYSSYFKLRRKRIISIIGIICMIAGVITSGARSGMVGLCVLFLMFLNKKLLSFKILFPAIAIVCLSFFFYSDIIYEIYYSIVDSNNYVGSSTDMRDGQFTIAFSYWLHNFLLGNGNGITGVLAARIPELWGAESIWMPAMIDRGLLGVLSLVMFFIGSIKYVMKKCPNKLLIFYVISIFVLFSMTSVPSVSLFFTFIYLDLANNVIKQYPLNMHNKYKQK